MTDSNKVENNINNNKQDKNLGSYKRELDIMRALISGPTTQSRLYVDFFTKEDGKKISVKNFRKVINRMVRNELLVSERFINFTDKRKRVTVYALGPAGVNEICLKYAIEREHVRAKLPSLKNIRHELYLSEIIRTIRKEESEKKRYKINILSDGNLMRKTFPVKKDMSYPDLKVQISSSEKNLEFNLELDTGDKGGKQWLKKLKNWTSGKTLVLCMTYERMKMLMCYIRNNRMPVPVCFALVDEFSRQENGKVLRGLVDTVWTIWSDKGKDVGKLIL